MHARVSIPVITCCALLSTLTPLWADEKPTVAVDVRFISMSETFFKKWAQLNLKPYPPAQVPFVLKGEGRLADSILGMVDLDERQLGQILHLAGSDKRTNILQAPKLTLFEGKPGHVDLTDRVHLLFAMTARQTPKNGSLVFTTNKEQVKLGFEMELEPKLSLDGHAIQLSTKFTQTELEYARVGVVEGQVTGEQVAPSMHVQQPQFSTLHFERTFTVPNGHTVAIGGCKRMVESCHESGPPILSRIPYVNRLFKTVGYGREVQSLLILITPSVLQPNPPVTRPTF